MALRGEATGQFVPQGPLPGLCGLSGPQGELCVCVHMYMFWLFINYPLKLSAFPSQQACTLVEQTIEFMDDSRKKDRVGKIPETVWLKSTCISGKPMLVHVQVHVACQRV